MEMTTTVKLVKLDGRHRGYRDWRWYVEAPRTRPIEGSKRMFFEWRNWCWLEWGPSKELLEYNHYDLFDGVYASNNHWCWRNDETSRARIYFKADEDASAFALRWI